MQSANNPSATTVTVTNIYPGGQQNYPIDVNPDKFDLIKHLEDKNRGPIVRIEFHDKKKGVVGYDIAYGILEQFCPSVVDAVNASRISKHNLTHVMVPVDDLSMAGFMIKYLKSYRTLLDNTGTVKCFAHPEKEPLLTYIRMIELAKPLGMVPLIYTIHKQFAQEYRYVKGKAWYADDEDLRKFLSWVPRNHEFVEIIKRSIGLARRDGVFINEIKVMQMLNEHHPSLERVICEKVASLHQAWN